jgi:cyclopropane fatty-acyl-phospholipid synthase-like methyltransferase
MELNELDVNWRHWFERWEAMQNCYVPRRIYRFDLMLKLPGLPHEAEVRILDLGCGPGSLSFLALQLYPNARILAVDFDPVLLALGQQVARGTTDHIEFKQVDIREGEWWKAHRSEFDLVVSATALHWLNADHLAQAFRRVYDVLKPGGWFFNSDHAASEDPQIQDLYREMLQQKRQAAFRATKADNWNGFWEALGRAVGQMDLAALRNVNHFWEGTDDGQPKVFHLTALRQRGFEQVEVYWQDLGEVVIGGQEPLRG